MIFMWCFDPVETLKKQITDDINSVRFGSHIFETGIGLIVKSEYWVACFNGWLAVCQIFPPVVAWGISIATDVAATRLLRIMALAVVVCRAYGTLCCEFGYVDSLPGKSPPLIRSI